LRLIALSLLGRTLRTLLRSDDTGAAMVRREPPPLLRLRTEEEDAAEIRVTVNRIREERPLVAVKLSSANGLVQQVLDSIDIARAKQALDEVRKFCVALVPTAASQDLSGSSETPIYTSEILKDRLRIEAAGEFSPENDIEDAVRRDIADQQFVASVMQMCRQHRRSDRRTFAPDEELALERAYRLLDEGVRLPRNYCPLEHTEDRPIQTYLSFADPGDGHLAVTVRDRSLLEGLIVHIEYIDRDNVDSKELIEAYRLPAVRNAARVRLHVGNTTPCTAFIGRPVFEGNSFELGLLKAGHTMASVCSAMFAQGIADCKVAMDGMTTKQTVEFMRIVAGNVVRDPVTQRLSAAFNINTDLVDDLFSRGLPRRIDKSASAEISEIAVILVALGRFNKIAWDGASDERPSRPIIGRLKHTHLLKLVHSAHERGLETYVSAGMDGQYMRDAVFIGIGGVGIGTSLHYNSDDGAIGEIDPGRVKHALAVQKDAAGTVVGRGASRLAQLDWRYAEGSLPEQLNSSRHELFKVLFSFLERLDKGGTSADIEIPQSIAEQLDNLIRQTEPLASRQAETRRSADSATPVSREPDFTQTARSSFSATADGRSTRVSDPVMNWAHRVIECFEVSKDNGGANPLDANTVGRIKEMLLAGDRDGLLRMYPV
jgi:hypothetical protein